MFFLVQGSIVSHAISIMSAHIRAVAHPRVLRLKSYFVWFSVLDLTFLVPFLCTNRQPCRKKTILAKVCFDAK